MTIPAVILFADAAAAQFRVGGLPLLTRHIKELYKLGVREFYLFGTTPLPQHLQHEGLSDEITLHAISTSGADLPEQLRTLFIAQQDVLLLQGTWLIDPRLFTALLVEKHAQWLSVPHAATELPVVARLSATSRHTWATAGLAAWLQDDPALYLSGLDTYSPAHRGPVPFYVNAIDTPADVAAATRSLIRASQKRALDLPALLFNPLFENRLVFWLCHTRITPNQVTLFTIIPGMVTALLFLNGWLRIGVLLAYAVAILDGVDGKLARTTLRTSRLGELEHILDFFIEQIWYLTMTIFLAMHTGKHELWWIGGGLMACDCLDKSLYGLSHRLFNKHLDELGLFDRQFRLIGGRRNIYLFFFIAGVWADVASQTLVLASAWALCTVVVHSGRLVYHMRHRVATA